MKMTRKKAVKKFSWRKTIVKAKTDSSQTRANKLKKNYVSNQVCAATAQPICYTLRHYPGVNPKQEAWGQPSTLFLLPRCQQGHHTCPAAPLSTPGHSATDGNWRLQWRWEAPSAPTSLFQNRGSSKGILLILSGSYLTEPSQKLAISLSSQKHELKFIIKSATAGQWMRGAPIHCLIYLCAAQNLDTERDCEMLPKWSLFFLLRLLNLSWLPKNIWETEINRFSCNTQTWKKFINLLPIEQKTQKLRSFVYSSKFTHCWWSSYSWYWNQLNFKCSQG